MNESKYFREFIAKRNDLQEAVDKLTAVIGDIVAEEPVKMAITTPTSQVELEELSVAVKTQIYNLLNNIRSGKQTELDEYNTAISEIKAIIDPLTA